MTSNFSLGDHVRWNSDAGYVEGRIIKIHTKHVNFEGHLRRCSPTDPQYEVRSDTTHRVTMHEKDALTLVE